MLNWIFVEKLIEAKYVIVRAFSRYFDLSAGEDELRISDALRGPSRNPQALRWTLPLFWGGLVYLSFAFGAQVACPSQAALAGHNRYIWFAYESKSSVALTQLRKAPGSEASEWHCNSNPQSSELCGTFRALRPVMRQAHVIERGTRAKAQVPLIRPMPSVGNFSL